MPPSPAPLRIRFEAKVSPEPTSGCHLWTGAVNNQGYGVIGIRDPDRKWRPKLAHRIAWQLATGRDPGDAVVAHRCDNRACTNVRHLFLTDAAGNLADMAAKDRSAFGERNAHAKLTSDDVAEIRSAYAAGRQDQCELAERFGVCQQLISRIISGQRWRRQASVGTRAGVA